AGVEYLEDQFIAFITVFPGKRLEVLKRRGLNFPIAVFEEHRFNGVEDVVAFFHFQGRKVTRALGQRGFDYCHSAKVRIDLLICPSACLLISRLSQQSAESKWRKATTKARSVPHMPFRQRFSPRFSCYSRGPYRTPRR